MFMKQVLLIGSAGSFIKTAHDSTKCTTPSGAIATTTKGIFLNCTPPVIKYPALCAGALTTSVVFVITRNPFVGSAALQCCEAIVDEIWGGG
jgi:hypothetical protein